MKITEDVRQYANNHQLDEQEALKEGMKEMSTTFKAGGGKIYSKV